MRILTPFAVLTLLAGCATLPSPRSCEAAADGLTTAAQIAQSLSDRGVAPAKAHKLAEAVAAGRMLLAAACAGVTAAPATN